MTEPMSTDALELYCRNRAGSTGGLTEYDRLLLMDVSDRLYALQTENAEKDKEIERLKSLYADYDSINRSLMRQTNELKTERDAVVALINKSALKPIKDCKHYTKCCQEAYDKMHMMKCPACDHWEWRGAQGEA